mmetsp:Transcript_62649/g.149440  ORF Transcript_62649/g.149440 Transcript_62649/m.149440 type:complete len:526 (+) Transcript_62649:135-1712(+)
MSSPPSVHSLAAGAGSQGSSPNSCAPHPAVQRQCHSETSSDFFEVNVISPSISGAASSAAGSPSADIIDEAAREWLPRPPKQPQRSPELPGAGGTAAVSKRLPYEDLQKLLNKKQAQLGELKAQEAQNRERAELKAQELSRCQLALLERKRDLMRAEQALEAEQAMWDAQHRTEEYDVAKAEASLSDVQKLQDSLLAAVTDMETMAAARFREAALSKCHLVEEAAAWVQQGKEEQQCAEDRWAAAALELETHEATKAIRSLEEAISAQAEQIQLSEEHALEMQDRAQQRRRSLEERLRHMDSSSRRECAQSLQHHRQTASSYAQQCASLRDRLPGLREELSAAKQRLGDGSAEHEQAQKRLEHCELTLQRQQQEKRLLEQQHLKDQAVAAQLQTCQRKFRELSALSALRNGDIVTGAALRHGALGARQRESKALSRQSGCLDAALRELGYEEGSSTAAGTGGCSGLTALLQASALDAAARNVQVELRRIACMLGRCPEDPISELTDLPARGLVRHLADSLIAKRS